MDEKKVHVLLHPLSREGATIKMKCWKSERRELLKSLKKILVVIKQEEVDIFKCKIQRREA